jgi:CelD/BcsL family acetyltransferase involved in cellulose biosynthesis
MSCATEPEAVHITDHDEKAGASLVNPLRRPDWDSLLEGHPQSSIFHGSAWARVLHDTYGHQPFYVAQFDGTRLAGLLPVMEVSSRLTGRRGVSLPFTDSCSSLRAEGCDGRMLYRTAMSCGARRRWKSLECRGSDTAWEGSSSSLAFYSHAIDLRVGVDRLLKNLEDASRRGVRKAQDGGLRVNFATGMAAMRKFYALHGGTRRRHGLPPQPWRFFENIQRHLMETGRGFVATVELEEKPLAAAVFFWHGCQGFYKFGASDYAFQQLRPNNLMMWSAIQHCAERGLHSLSLGRSSLCNEGLRRFKLGLGAAEEKVHYGKYDFASKQFVTDVDRVEGWFNRVFASLPLPLLRLAGRILYPHLS